MVKSNPFNKHFSQSSTSRIVKSISKSGKKKRSNVIKPKNNTPMRSENPFDKFNNSKKKHDVVNRRVKGDERDVGRAKKKVSST